MSRPPTPLSEEAKQRIDDEAQVVCDVMHSLNYQMSTKDAQLRNEAVRARELNSQIVNARREEDRQMLASDEAVSHSLYRTNQNDIDAMNKLVKKPYFARVVLEESPEGGGNQKKIVEYKLGFASNIECRIIDWRKAPIARLYYEYDEGDEYSELIQGRERNGRVILRNKVVIEDGKLTRLSCRLGTFENVDNAWRTASGAYSKGTGAQGRLPNILSLITPEQFRMITEDADSAIIIQGIAGSGKTTVALHRLAWLLHEDNSPLKPNEAMVLVLSNSLRRYIEHTLPTMDISGVRVDTFTNWCHTVLSRISPDTFIHRSTINQSSESRDVSPFLSTGRVKGSVAMLKCLENYVRAQNRRLVAHLEANVPWQVLPKELYALLDNLRSSSAQSLKKLKSCASIPVLRKIIDALNANASSVDKDVIEALSAIEAKLCLFTVDILAILNRSNSLIAEDETHLLDVEIIKQTYAYTKERYEAKNFDANDLGLIFRLAQLKFGDSLCPILGIQEFKHIVVDEVQDFSVPQLAVILNLVKNMEQLTLAGDSSQHTSLDGSFIGWDRLRRYWDEDGALSTCVQLTVNHRSTQQIMRLADHVSGVRNKSKSGKSGRRPLWTHCFDENDGIRQSIIWLEKVLEYSPGTMAIVACKDSNEASYVFSLLEPTFGHVVRLGDDLVFSFNEGICVTHAEQIKGLEFPHVLLWNPSHKAYPNKDRARNLLYIAITRAEDHLGIVTWDKPSCFLPDIYSQLVRGRDMTTE